MGLRAGHGEVAGRRAAQGRRGEAEYDEYDEYDEPDGDDESPDGHLP
ncbi:hypothetical protein JNW88_07525 [Micromonospora sp. ATA32]|nr:hypothetical protein [Micromonospora sp. ATA32]